MNKSFDEILEEGKSKAKVVPDPQKQWRETINNLMNDIHKLNSFYGDKQHYVKIGQIRCKKCQRASYAIVLRDINDLQRSIRYHRGGWKPVDKDTYYCNVCK